MPWRQEAVGQVRRSWASEVAGGLGGAKRVPSGGSAARRLVVFVPEPRGGHSDDYAGQIEWEERCLHLADVVVFWVPRDLETLPGFTTNVEWGMWHDSGRVVFGAPPGAPKNGYLLHYAVQSQVPVAETLGGVIDAAMARIGPGAPRHGGEREVPLLIWHTDSFQRWYRAQAGAGNRLLGARLVWTFRAGPDRRLVVYWALHVRVHIVAEDRVKGNEVVISRPDIAAVALYRRGATAAETVVVLVREFRAPASTPDGFVRELPGGAIDEPLKIAGGLGDVPPGESGAAVSAVRELAEETGLAIDPARLRCHERRQLAATVSAHGAWLFSAEITGEELTSLRAGGHLPHGAPDSGTGENAERTYAEVTTFGQVLASRQVDWATLGMLAQVLCAPG